MHTQTQRNKCTHTEKHIHTDINNNTQTHIHIHKKKHEKAETNRNTHYNKQAHPYSQTQRQKKPIQGKIQTDTDIKKQTHIYGRRITRMQRDIHTHTRTKKHRHRDKNTHVLIVSCLFKQNVPINHKNRHQHRKKRRHTLTCVGKQRKASSPSSSYDYSAQAALYCFSAFMFESQYFEVILGCHDHRSVSKRNKLTPDTFSSK